MPLNVKINSINNFCIQEDSINGELDKSEPSIAKPLEHDEVELREQAPEHLPNWADRTIVYQDEKEEQAPKCLTDWINSFAKKLDELSNDDSSLVIIEI